MEWREKKIASKFKINLRSLKAAAAAAAAATINFPHCLFKFIAFLMRQLSLIGKLALL